MGLISGRSRAGRQLRSTVRLARSSPLMTLGDIARVHCTEPAAVVSLLESLPGRGFCARLAAEALAQQQAPAGVLAGVVSFRGCPPGTARTAIAGAPDPEILTHGARAAGTAVWAARAVAAAGSSFDKTGAQHPAKSTLTPAGTLRAICRHLGSVWDAASNRAAPAAVLHAMAGRPDDGRTHACIAANPASGPETAALLSIHHHDGVRATAVKHPDMPGVVAAGLSADSDWWVRIAAAASPSLPADLLAALSHSDDAETAEGAARNPTMCPESLSRLSCHPHRDVREAVASNPATPAATLEQLATDRESDVRSAAAAATSSATTLQRLANDRDDAVREEVASNPATPAATLEQLATDRDPAVLIGLAVNRSSTTETLERLRRNPDMSVHLRSARHPNLGPEALDAASRASHRDVRAAAASNPAASVRLLRSLGADSDPAVSAAVARTVAERLGQTATGRR